MFVFLRFFVAATQAEYLNFVRNKRLSNFAYNIIMATYLKNNT